MRSRSHAPKTAKQLPINTITARTRSGPAAPSLQKPLATASATAIPPATAVTEARVIRAATNGPIT